MADLVPTAPARTDPRPEWGEPDTLLGHVRWQRLTLRHKCEGLTAGQLRTAAVPTSSLTLAGWLKHLALVEESWLVERFRGPAAAGAVGGRGLVGRPRLGVPDGTGRRPRVAGREIPRGLGPGRRDRGVVRPRRSRMTGEQS